MGRFRDLNGLWNNLIMPHVWVCVCPYSTPAPTFLLSLIILWVFFSCNDFQIYILPSKTLTTELPLLCHSIQNEVFKKGFAYIKKGKNPTEPYDRPSTHTQPAYPPQWRLLNMLQVQITAFLTQSWHQSGEIITAAVSDADGASQPCADDGFCCLLNFLTSSTISRTCGRSWKVWV